jgi:hypothetical protein
VVDVCDEPPLNPIVASVEAAGLSGLDLERCARRPHSTLMEIHPPGDEAGHACAPQLLDKYQPPAVVFIAKTGPNANGVPHSITGTAKHQDETGHAFHLAESAKARGIVTIGVGEGGNKIGNGRIYDAARQRQPYGLKCQCDCGDGGVPVTATDVLISASVSNWGAYGIAA